METVLILVVILLLVVVLCLVVRMRHQAELIKLKERILLLEGELKSKRGGNPRKDSKRRPRGRVR